MLSVRAANPTIALCWERCREQSRLKKNDIRATLSIYTSWESGSESKLKNSGFLVLETCSYTQTSFALIKPPTFLPLHLVKLCQIGEVVSKIVIFLQKWIFFFSASLLLGPLKICWSTGKISLSYGTMPLQEFGNRIPKYLPPTRNELGWGPVPVHLHLVSARTRSLGSLACCKWKITFLSVGICLVEKHKVFVSIQQVKLWDLWILLEYTPIAVPKVVLSDRCGNNP